ncbi:hypothetical protein ATO6_01755 [Oceanicola sp. 22II-s10i]|uniref:acetate--CoA ligase family protein n=1 Tax=Oceanicola sp. 22II-s10i TaxID=1317116 RepID=UPI000B5229D7|nr:acetate--CoA ligase family protein [Oceanicola sp. 22II-s10i]OWU86713.1 hypothetical protein ATO6_01755 [Oceanicola sp. 22II-s10i]
MNDSDAAGLSALFEPKSIAVIGASGDPQRIGGRPIDFCKRGGFKGAIYPVNPTRDEVQGLKSYPDLAAIPGPVDMAILAIPAARVIETLEACGAKGVKAAVCFSAGFAEIGGDGVAAQDEMIAVARRHGIRLLGPNCLGLYGASVGAGATFSSALEGEMPKRGGIGLITQSGAYGTHLLCLAKDRRLGIAGWVSTGNEADVSVAECLEYMVERDDVTSVGLYLEGINRADTLIAALKKARELRKPVVIMKVGASEVGAKAAQSHTASLAGSDASVQAVIEQFGAHRAKTTEEMFDILYAASIAPIPPGDRLGIITVSGGAGVLMADAAATYGLSVPPMPEASVAKLMERNPFSSPRNPVDVTAHALNDFDLIPENLEEMIRIGLFDSYVAFFTSWVGSASLGPRLREALMSKLKGFDRPFALVGLCDAEVSAAYDADGVLTFEDPSRAVAALGALAKFGRSFDTAAQGQGALPEVNVAPIPARTMGEAEAKAIIAEAGVPILPEVVAPTADEAAQAAEVMGYPVAMKIVSPDIAHKTDIGGVALNLADAEAVRRTAERMLTEIPKLKPEAKIEGVLVSPMAGAGVELIVGTQQDASMGPMVMVGLGGILAEVLKDVALARAPVTKAEALGMLSRLRGAAMLDGVRGAPPVDRDAIADIISRLSVLAAANANTVESIEINPLLARPDGPVALDALIVPRDPAT